MSAPLPFPAFPLEDYRQHEAAIKGALDRVLGGPSYILGPEVAAFEEEFAGWIGAAHAVGVANGTDAVELLLRAHGVGAGDRVAVPSHTAVASISAIERAGARPVFLDIDPATRTITAETLRAALARTGGATDGLKAVLVVHLYGHPAPMEALAAACREAGLLLLEDCAQAHGAQLGSRRAGSLADGAAFSFYPTKNLGAIGDGGAVCVNDASLAERLKWLRQYGWAERYVSKISGVNSRLDELQAAVLRVKLATLDKRLDRRAELAERYRSQAGHLPWLELPTVAPGATHAWHLYVVRTAHRDRLAKHLEHRGIPAAIHYPAAVHQQPAYASLNPGSAHLAETERLLPEILTLPLHPYLSRQHVDAVCDALLAFDA